ncbi:MAG: nicotinamide-nucleotide adenylyltransferase [Candidatus Bathyarchaeia archaeon]
MAVRGRQPLCALYVGRFQPFHKGHLHAVRYILSKADQLLVVVGSAQYSHTRRNPFSAGERITMIYRALDSEGVERARYSVFPVPDIHAHSLWVPYLISYLPRFDVVYTNEPLVKRLFEEDGHYRVEPIPLLERETFNATEIRQRMITERDWSDLVPDAVRDYIREIKGDRRVRDLAQRDKPAQIA